MASYRARVTSKNQLTLPAGVSAFLHVRPGDDVVFDIDDEGRVDVSGPPFRERAAAWAGKWATEPPTTTEEIDAWVRELRGDRE